MASTMTNFTQEVAELRRQVALENLQNQRLDNYDQDVPVEFECCFCTTKVSNQFHILSTKFNHL